MPKGCFVILLPVDAEYKVLGYYFKGEQSTFEITSDLFLRLNLDHSKTEYNYLKLKDFTIVSFLHKFKGKISRKASGSIIGLLLEEDEDAESFKIPLKKGAEALETLNFLEMSKTNFEKSLKELYQEHLETITDVLDPTALKENIINRTKEMLSGGKKERKLATELLQKIEAKVHTKIITLYKTAENALKSEDYAIASKNFNKAADIAEELLDIELAKSLREKADITKDVPAMEKKLDMLIDKARNFLRNEDFHLSYTFFKKASDLAKRLMLTDKEEEYRLKAKALQDFYQIDQKYKSKKSP